MSQLLILREGLGACSSSRRVFGSTLRQELAAAPHKAGQRAGFSSRSGWTAVPQLPTVRERLEACSRGLTGTSCSSSSSRPTGILLLRLHLLPAPAGILHRWVLALKSAAHTRRECCARHMRAY